MSSSSKAKTGASSTTYIRLHLFHRCYRKEQKKKKKDGSSKIRFLCFQVNIMFDVLRALPLIDYYGRDIVAYGVYEQEQRKHEEVKVVCLFVSEE